jgi:hypothetical protein
MYSFVLQLRLVAINYLEFLHFSYCKKCEVMASSIIFYERTPTLADFENKTLSGQHQAITRLSCYRASLRSR